MSERDVRLLCAVLFAVLVATVQIVSAQDDETVLVLAQSMVAEGNWNATADHAAIAHLLQRRADRRGVSLAHMCRSYVAAFRVTTPRTRWIRGLRLDAAEPDGWPARYSWPAHVDRWRAVLASSQAFLDGSLPDPCPGSDHFGMVSGIDMRRMQSERWERMECNTRNAFWRRVSR